MPVRREPRLGGLPRIEPLLAYREQLGVEEGDGRHEQPEEARGLAVHPLGLDVAGIDRLGHGRVDVEPAAPVHQVEHRLHEAGEA